jgi:hypothetical protein
MRGLLYVVLPAAIALLAACDQDSYSSTAERNTHMGDVRAAAPAAPASSAPAASAAAPSASAPPAASH